MGGDAARLVLEATRMDAARDAPARRHLKIGTSVQSSFKDVREKQGKTRCRVTDVFRG